jgi:hypothetical protein
MNYPVASSPILGCSRPVRPISLRRIALPTEHGSWGFLGEPLIAGLAIAFSPAAPWIAVMTIGAFLLRQPLRVLVANRLGRRDAGVTSAAFGFALFYLITFATGLAGTLTVAGMRPLIPFSFVVPLIAVQIYFDTFRRSRALVPEIAGAITISASVAAIAIAGGFTSPFVVALWLVFIARSVPSILYVRERLRLAKGKAHSLLAPRAAHTAALLLVSILALFGFVPLIAPVAMMILLFRATTGLSPGRKKMRAMQIGVREVIYGTATVLILVTGYYSGL